jgi:hypothetical protein
VEGELRAIQLAIVRSRWPELLTESASQAEQDLGFELISGSVPALRVRGIQLASRHDPQAEAHLQEAHIAHASRVTLYGLGQGELPRCLLGRPELTELRIVVLNRALLRGILDHVDWTDWLVDPRVHMSLGSEERHIEHPCFAVPSDLELLEDAAWRLRDRLLYYLQTAVVNRRFSRDVATHVQRLAENMPYIEADRNVMELFGTAQGRNVYVIGAGPSLLETIGHLESEMARTQDARPVLIAADTALRTLLAHGITPNFIVAMDPYLRPQYLEAQGRRDIGLVYFPLVPGAILGAWGGPRYLALSNSPLYASLLQPNRGVLWAGGSVIHPAVDLAVRLGTRRVTLFGVDFAFVGGRTHAGWENGELGKDLLNAEHWVMNDRGEKVPSSVNFASYLCALEDYIEARSHVHFFNSSREGAAIRGATFTDLS